MNAIRIASLPGRRFEAAPPATRHDSCQGCVFQRAFYPHWQQPNNHPMTYTEKVKGCDASPNCEGHVYHEVGYDPRREV